MIAHRGFTLIELMAASAAAVILVGAVFGVLGGITRDRQKLITAHLSDKNNGNSIVELLRHDLASATSLKEEDGTIVVNTFNRLEAASMESTDRPSLVTWRLDNEVGVQCLLRVQDAIDEPVPPAPFIALIACHVRRIGITAIKPIDDRKISTTDSKSKSDQMPARIRLKVEFDDSSAAIDSVLCLR